MYVQMGLREKFQSGVANGVPPLGTKNAYIRRDGTPANARDRSSRAIRVIDEEKMPALRALLSRYADKGSYRKTADWLNAQGFTNREGTSFTTASVKEVIRNPFFGPEEVVIFHRGDVDEVRRETEKERQIFPDDIHSLWLQAQEKRKPRSSFQPSTKGLVYPLHPVLRCSECGSVYNGQPREGTRYSEHRGPRTTCRCPFRVKSEKLEAQFFEMMNQVAVPRSWKQQILRLLDQSPVDEHVHARDRLQRAVARIQDMYKWGDLDPDDYRSQARSLQEQLAMIPPPAPVDINNYRSAVDLPSIMASTTPPPSSGYKSGCICRVRRQPSLNFESPLFGPAPVPTLGATRRISRCQPVSAGEG